MTSEESKHPPYDAITLDTCIYVEHRFKFDEGLLNSLKNVSIDIIISKVIVDEVSHKISEQYNKLNEVLEKIKQYPLFLPDEKKLLENISENKNLIDVWHRHIDERNMKVVDSNLCDMNEVFTRYFNVDPPFQNGKKHEFPDAVALLSLEAWAKENNKKILAVSADKDWLTFESDYIEVVKDSKTALKKIENQNFSGAKESIEKIFLSLKEYDNFYDEFNDELKYAVELMNVKADKNEIYLSSYSMVVIKIESPEYIENSFYESHAVSDIDITIIDYSKKATDFIISCNIDITAMVLARHVEDTLWGKEAKFDVATSEEHTVPIDILISLKGDVNAEDYMPEISSLSISNDVEIKVGSDLTEFWRRTMKMRVILG